MKIKIKIQGKTPLLMCRFSEEQLDSPRIKDKNIAPKQMAEKYAYRNANNELYIPGINIFSAIIEAGKFHKIGKNKITTLKSSIIPAGMMLLEKECLLGTKDFEVDSRSVVVPATGGRIMCHRPRLDKWSTSFTLEIDVSQFSENNTQLLVQDAGSKCGLLAYRPSRKGWFGKFEIIEWEII